MKMRKSLQFLSRKVREKISVTTKNAMDTTQAVALKLTVV